ncbi:MAG: hypothetical protein RL732_106 [Bacteroidota bacterium]
MARTFILLLSFFGAQALHGQQQDSLMIRRIADSVLINGSAYENLRALCKNVGGRLAGSPQMIKAEAWGVAALKRAGADKVFLQECKVPHWVRGAKESAYYIMNGKKVELDVLALGNSVGTGTKGVSAPVLLINDFDELEKRKDEVKGKIVFYNYKFDPRFIRTFQSYGDAGRYRGQGPSRAARYGAVAVIVRSMSHATDNNPHTGATNYDTAYAKIPALAVGLKDADRLAAVLEQNKPVNVVMHSYAEQLPDVTGHNVIGEWVGTESPEQIITIGGHLDSWDPAEGAHDDGAGCVQSIEVLRALKAAGYVPRRTIRIVLFANEENGLRGGTQYAADAKKNGEKHFFALESDAGGFTPRGFGFSVSKEQLGRIQGWLELFKPYGVFELSAGGGGADIGPLGRAFNTPMAGFVPDSQRYFDVHHARNDVFENVNKRELELGALNMAALIYLVDKYGL